MACIRVATLMRLFVCLLMCTYFSAGELFSDDGFLIYETTSANSASEPQDSFIHDMVFMDTKHIVRLKRQSDSLPPEKDDKSKPSSGPKKVPSGFNSTITGKPSKTDTSGKKIIEKTVSQKDANATESSDMNVSRSTVSTVATPSASQTTTVYPTPTPVDKMTIKKGDSVAPVLDVMDSTQGTGPMHEALSESDDDDYIARHTDEIGNATLKEQKVNKTEVDQHQYYNSSATLGLNSYWVNMSALPNVTTNHMLSKAHRRAATVTLTFAFPFYGHLVHNVTIATGGFLYTGEYVHSWLAATQYIAPLMANFDTSLSDDSFVKYVDNGTAFTVEWCNVALQDRPMSGHFSFQATLHKNGDIVFVYRSVPVEIDKIKDDNHPVKVGLSDAYIIDRTIFFVRRKTIYEYHRVNFQNIQNGTVIYLKALPTCLDLKDCNTCLTNITNFECKWCATAQRCSNGMDRFRQDWLLNGCEMPDSQTTGKIIQHSDQCYDDADLHHMRAGEEILLPEEAESHHESPDSIPVISRRDHLADENVGMSLSSIAGFLTVVVLLSSIGLWVLYAYRHPHSTSGQWLIRYRPSAWGWRRGEARYTAATIHM